MKTPRDILLERHQAAESKLDKIRASVVGEGRRAAVPEVTVADTVPLSESPWREFLFSLRWHFAALSAVWLVIAFLSLGAGHSPSLAAAVSAQKIPSAQIIMASLRENRRQLWELTRAMPGRNACWRRNRAVCGVMNSSRSEAYEPEP